MKPSATGPRGVGRRLALVRPSPLAMSALLALSHCGGAPPPKPAAPAAKSASEAPVASPDAADGSDKALPEACAGGGDGGYCLPPPAFVKRLCGSAYPTVALALFRKGTPWTRAYLTRNTEAWNASGGASSSGTLAFDEEVIVLTHRVPDTGGMVVSGASGGFDVLRWDGSCASLEAQELTTKVPPKPRSAKVPWKILEDDAQKALRADEKIGKIDAERRKECKGVTMGAVSAKCERADRDLGLAVVDYVRQGGDLPRPVRLP